MTILSVESPAAPSHVSPRSRCALSRVLHVINGEHYSGAERVQDHRTAWLAATVIVLDMKKAD